ncbi:hypothetical protein [Geobacter hydrogenophilus]|nr:hypothetical protein [Geobacter hydrogenophilus]
MNKKWLVMISMIVMACALLAGCGGSSGGSGGGTTGTISGTAK